MRTATTAPAAKVDNGDDERQRLEAAPHGHRGGAMTCGVPRWKHNVAQRGDALGLLTSLPDACAALAFFDPQHRSVLDHLKFGNEGARQRGRAALPAMTEDYIDACSREIARALVPSGYCMRWVDTYGLCEAHHRRVADCLKCVDCIAWDNLRPGMGKRSRRRGDFLLVLQKPPVTAANWRDRMSNSIGLITRLIAAVTLPGDLVIDPAAGSFGVLHAALRLEREFIGCDAVACNSDQLQFHQIIPGLASHGAQGFATPGEGKSP